MAEHSETPNTSRHRLKRAAFLLAALSIAAAVLGYWRLSGESNSPAPVVDMPTPEGMVLVSGSTFTMGRDNGARSKNGTLLEGPAHRVVVGPFYMDIYEVTNRQYREFVAATGYPAPRHWTTEGSYGPEMANHPVTHVTWIDASAFARWKGKRLPTEEEWECAARGGGQGFLFPWGNEFSAGDANLDNTHKGPMPVGSFTKDRSSAGIFDLAGNVSEWVDDIYQPYLGTASRQWRVFRGGNFRESHERATATYRFWDLPTIPDPRDKANYQPYIEQMEVIGFRCAQNAPGK